MQNKTIEKILPWEICKFCRYLCHARKNLVAHVYCAITREMLKDTRRARKTLGIAQCFHASQFFFNNFEGHCHTLIFNFIVFSNIRKLMFGLVDLHRVSFFYKTTTHGRVILLFMNFVMHAQEG